MNFIKNDEIKSINHCKMNKTLKLLQSSKFNQLSKSEIFQEISFLLMKIKSLNSQYSLNGKDNIWILKPAGLSRGRGICCISKYNEFLKFLKSNGNHFVAQKYIENPLIIHKRKVLLI